MSPAAPKGVVAPLRTYQVLVEGRNTEMSESPSPSKSTAGPRTGMVRLKRKTSSDPLESSCPATWLVPLDWKATTGPLPMDGELACTPLVVVLLVAVCERSVISPVAGARRNTSAVLPASAWPETRLVA